MKYLTFLKNVFLSIGLLCCLHSEAQIFVNKSASGRNNGSSWEHAFTDLQEALKNVEETEQIWVAKGTYFPGNPGAPDSVTFHITKGIELYGGFAGTESHLSERKAADYPTILSGDLEQNDIADDFETNRRDNISTVMLIENKSNTRPIIDGFTFQNGHADGGGKPYQESAGGALYLYSPALIKNCFFTQNYSRRRGGAILFFDLLSIENVNLRDDQINLIIDNCQFTNNYSKYGGAVNIRLQNGKVSSAVIRNSDFISNTSSEFGGGIVLYTTSDSSLLVVDSCNFFQNFSKRSMGAIYGLSFGKASSIIIKNSNFERNHSGKTAGAINIVARGRSVNNKLIIEHCDFDNNYIENTSGGFEGGAAVYISPYGTKTLASIRYSNFKKNKTNGWGGAMAIVTGNDGVDNRIEIDHCQFENNRSNCGGAILYMSKGSNDSLLIRQSQFNGNSVEGTHPGLAPRGGAIDLAYVPEGKKAYSRIEDCWFENNTNKVSDGGAIYIEQSRSGIFSSIYNSTFMRNNCIGKGGAFAYGGADHAYELEACTFENNRANQGDAHIYEIPHFDGSLFYIFFHGVLWVQILYCLFLFLISRERTTLYYSLLMIGLSLFHLVISEALNLILHIHIPISFRTMLGIGAVFLGITGLVKFAQHYLNVNHFIPWFKNAINYFLILFFISQVAHYYFVENPSKPFDLEWGEDVISILANLLIIIGALVPVFWGIVVLRKGYKPAKYFLLAMFFAGLAIAITVFSFMEFTHIVHIPIIKIQSLILLTIIALGLADGYRVNLLKKDKARAEKLAELDIAKTRLYNNITHEFRTPLTVIMGTTEMIRGNDPEKKLLQRNSKQLLQLINQMLDLSKLEGGALKLEKQQSDIIPFIEYLVESFQSLAASKYIQLTFYKELEELEMDYDAQKIQAIITNLISNAIKFTPESGKVVVHVKTDLINKKSHLMLTVRDSGSGIPEEDIPHIFDRFFQVDASDMRRSEGSGIGLALVKELVQLMKGSIEVTSKLEKGSVFTFRIPITNEAPLQAGGISKQEVIAPPVSPTESGGIEPFLPVSDELPLALIIEDNRDVVSFLRACLQKKYKLEVAYNGQEGIEKALEIVPDIIISDVMMPEADGYTVCKTIKADERTSHIPIIMLTAKATQEDKIHGLDMGADAYLTKPFIREELEIRLEKLIELRAQLQKHYKKTLSLPDKTVEVENPFIQKLRTVIEERIEDESFGIRELCQIVNLSRMQVHRKLKALTDMPTTTFINTIRLQRAYRLLEETKLNVSEVAYKVGFSDHAYFTRLFVKKFGITPSEVSKKE